MAQRLPWDIFESVIMLDALISVYSGDISRNSAIESVSSRLRERAKANGIETDDVFRNTNGIKLQMSIMEYIFTDGKQGLKKSSEPWIFREAVDMYRYDRATYEETLKEANGVSESKSTQELFFEWLRSQVSATQLSDLYLAYADIEDFCIKRSVIKKKLFELSNINDIRKVANVVETNKVLRYVYKRSLSKMRTAILMYWRFVNDHPEVLDQNSNVKPAPDNIVNRQDPKKDPDDQLIEYLSNHEIQYIDYRSDRSGCLWILGSHELQDVVDYCKDKFGVIFYYNSGTARVLNGKSGWWTRQYARNIHDNVNSVKDVTDTPKMPSKANTAKDEVSSFQPDLPECRTADIEIEKSKFEKWMLKSGFYDSTIKDYLSAIKMVDDIALGYNICKSSLYTINDVPKLQQILKELIDKSSFREFNIQQHNKLSVALTKLIEYRSDSRDHSDISKNTLPKPTDSAMKRIISDVYVQQTNTSTPKPQQPIPDEALLRYKSILEENFSDDGYQPGRAIFLGRLKKFYSEKFGNPPAEDDDLIDKIMKTVGAERDGRIYPKQDESQNEILSEIVSCITTTLDSGISAVYASSVYEKYKEPLAEKLHIYNVDSLVSAIPENVPWVFSSYRGVFSKKYSAADTRDDLIQIMKEFHEPQSCSAIYEKAWFLPQSKVKTLLVSTASIVNTAPNTYFYAPNLPVSDKELGDLSSLINSKLMYQSYMTQRDLFRLIDEKCHCITIDTEAFTSHGLYNCLKYLLGRKFSFRGSVITLIGKELNAADIYAEFARDHETMTNLELVEFSDEVSLPINWKAVLSESIRISSTKLVRKDQISFDTEAIDDILDGLCSGNYVPICDVNTFLYFPNVGYPWNTYLLVSYLSGFSKKFSLIQASATESSAIGAMVRISTGISNYRSLIVEVLSNSNAMKSSSAALQYLVDNGYQLRRSYSDIDAVLREARQLKEQREKQ